MDEIISRSTPAPVKHANHFFGLNPSDTTARTKHVSRMPKLFQLLSTHQWASHVSYLRSATVLIASLQTSLVTHDVLAFDTVLDTLSTVGSLPNLLPHELTFAMWCTTLRGQLDFLNLC